MVINVKKEKRKLRVVRIFYYNMTEQLSLIIKTKACILSVFVLCVIFFSDSFALYFMQVSAHGGWGSGRGSKLVLHHRKSEKL